MTSLVCSPLAVRAAYLPRVPTEAELARRSPEGREALLAKRPRHWAARPSVVVVDVVTGPDQALLWGFWSQWRFGHEVAAGVVVADGDEEAFREAEKWAAGYQVGSLAVRSRATLVQYLSDWGESLLRPLVVGTGELVVQGKRSSTWLAAWDAPRVISRLARRGAPGKGRNYGGFSFDFFAHPDDPSQPGNPRVTVRSLSEYVSIVRFGTLPGENPPRPGPIIDVRHWVRALAGPGVVELAQAARAFGLRVPMEGAHPLDGLADRVRLLGQLARACLSEFEYLEAWERGEGGRPRGLLVDPRQVYSGGSLATALLRSVGVPPLSEMVLGGPLGHNRVAGAFASANFGPLAEVFSARDPSPAVHADFSACFVMVGRLEGHSDFLLAARHEAEVVTDEARAEVERLAACADPVAELLRPGWWRKWGVVVVRAEPNRALLPVRTPVPRKAGEFLVRRTHVDAAPGSAYWWYLTDVVAGLLDDPRGPLPRVVEGLRVVPVGRAEGLRAVELPGGVRFDPVTDDLYAQLLAARDACANHPGWTETQRQRRKAMVKGLGVSLAFGNLSRVDRQPVPPRPSRRRAEGAAPFVLGPDGEAVPAGRHEAVERPGPDYCPWLAGAVTSGARLLASLVCRQVRDAGGEVAQVLVDSFTVMGGPDMRTIARRLYESLGVILRLEHGTDERPVRAYVMGRNRYVLTRGHRLVHVAEFALGGTYLDPTGTAAVGDSGARAWVEEAAAQVVRADNGRTLADFDLPPWGQHLAVSAFRAATPEQLHWLGPGAMPFDQGLASHRSLVEAGDGRGSPVARAPWGTPPKDWPSLDWRWRDGEPATLLDPRFDGGANVPGAFCPETVADVVWRWAQAGEPGKRPERDRDAVQAHRGRLVPLPVFVTGRPLLIGKEGTELVERGRGTESVEEPVLTYGPVAEAEVAAVQRVVAAMLPKERAGLGLSERTARAAAAGRVPRGVAELVSKVAREAVGAFGDDDDLPEDRLSLLVAYAEKLEHCGTGGCPNLRGTRSPLCQGCRAARHREASAQSRARRKEVVGAPAA